MSVGGVDVSEMLFEDQCPTGGSVIIRKDYLLQQRKQIRELLEKRIPRRLKG